MHQTKWIDINTKKEKKKVKNFKKWGKSEFKCTTTKNTISYTTYARIKSNFGVMPNRDWVLENTTRLRGQKFIELALVAPGLGIDPWSRLPRHLRLCNSHNFSRCLPQNAVWGLWFNLEFSVVPSSSSSSSSIVVWLENCQTTNADWLAGRSALVVSRILSRYDRVAQVTVCTNLLTDWSIIMC